MNTPMKMIVLSMHATHWHIWLVLRTYDWIPSAFITEKIFESFEIENACVMELIISKRLQNYLRCDKINTDSNLCLTNDKLSFQVWQELFIFSLIYASRSWQNSQLTHYESFHLTQSRETCTWILLAVKIMFTFYEVQSFCEEAKETSRLCGININW